MPDLLSKLADRLRLTDDACAYSTPRTLVIRDRRIGIALHVTRLAIFIYILSTIFSSERYMAPSDFLGSVRLSLREPAAALRWQGGQAPFCAGVTAAAPPPGSTLGAQYAILSGTTYSFNGGAPLPRRPCAYLDAAAAAPLQESDRSFLVTESRVTNQNLTEIATGLPCVPASVATAGCAYLPAYAENDTAITVRRYVPDVEFFTLLIDHSIRAPLANVARTVRQMSGEMRDAGGALVSPCAAYTDIGLACPRTTVNPVDGSVTPGVQVGSDGLPDLFPIKTLLQAAGISSLDTIAGSDNAAAQTSSFRSQGLILLVELSYSNYRLGRIVTSPGQPPIGGTGSWNNGNVRYTYRVSTVPATQFQTVSAANQFESEALRSFERRYGIRILVTTTGTIGYFDFQSLFVNLVVSLGLLSVAVTIMEFLIFNVCKRRGLYSRLREEPTVRIGDLLVAAKAHPGEFKKLIASLDEVTDDDELAARASLNLDVAAFVAQRRPTSARGLSPSVVVKNPLADAGADKAPPTEAWGAV